MPVRGTIIQRIAIPEIDGVSRRQAAAAAKSVAAELQQYAQARCSRPYPPASRYGQYPRTRSGELVSGINVTGTANYITIASEAMHGVYLEDPLGTMGSGARKWASKAWNAKDWLGRIEKRARGKK